MSLYNTIGKGYAASRPADARIVAALKDALALPSGATLLDVGAGTGKYARALADLGYSVIAVEPSAVMRAQGSSHTLVRWIEAKAESIPLPSGSAQGAFIVLALHHFQDRVAAFSEILRIIGAGPFVIFTFEPSLLNQFWLAEYFPTLGRERTDSFSALPDVAAEIRQLTNRQVRTIPFPLPRDLDDKFVAALWARPEAFLDPVVRNGISSFALMSPDIVEAGLQKLESDLKTGRWDAKHGHLRTAPTLDTGYKLILTT